MVSRVSDVEQVPVRREREALWLIERGLIERAILAPLRAAADNGL